MEEQNAEVQVSVRVELDKMAAQFKAALPPHIPVERFVRVVMTAVNGDPALVAADRRSLLEAAMKCAQDGLLPDGRDAAFVVYRTNTAPRGQDSHYISKVQYLPMVWGIIKKVRNSGELQTITSQVVYENDGFDYTLGDDEKIEHKPNLKGDRGKPVLAYAIAKTKDGGIYREIMTATDIESVRQISKAKDSGPWAGPFRLEMWRKTVLRRLSKRLPMSTDLEQVIQRDDELYDMNAETEELPKIEPPKRKSESGGNGVKAETTKSQEPEETQAERIEKWIKESTDDEFLAVPVTEFAKDCAGLKGAEIEELTKLYNDRRAPLMKRKEAKP